MLIRGFKNPERWLQSHPLDLAPSLLSNEEDLLLPPTPLESFHSFCVNRRGQCALTVYSQSRFCPKRLIFKPRSVSLNFDHLLDA